MKEKVYKCGVIGAAILFTWGWISWGILPWHKNQYKAFTNESSVKDVMLNQTKEGGFYTIPSMDKCGQEKGPFIFASIKRDYTCSMLGASISMFIVKFVAACVVTWLLLQTKLDYKKSVTFITVIGFLIPFAALLSNVIWMGFPPMYAVTNILDSMIGWFFAGLAIAKFARK